MKQEENRPFFGISNGVSEYGLTSDSNDPLYRLRGNFLELKIGKEDIAIGSYVGLTNGGYYVLRPALYDYVEYFKHNNGVETMVSIRMEDKPLWVPISAVGKVLVRDEEFVNNLIKAYHERNAHIKKVILKKQAEEKKKKS